MAFSDCDDSADPCLIKARALDSVVKITSGFSPVKLFPNNCSQLEILKLPFITSFDEIRAIFGKYGPISRVSMDYRCDESSLICYLTFENESNSVEALNENERIIGSNRIVVRKYAESEATKGNKRLRTDDNSNSWSTTTTVSSDAWSSANATDSWGSTSTSDDFSDGSSRGRRRGRGGGRGGGVGGRTCFNCGEEGHMSRECLKPRAGGSRGGPRTCFNCGEEGHMSRECPKGGSRGGGRACFNCGEEGHMSRECSKPRGEGGRGRRGRGGHGSDFASSSSAGNEADSAPQTLDW